MRYLWILVLVATAMLVGAAEDGIRVVSWPTSPGAQTAVAGAAVTAVPVSNAAVVLLPARTARLKAILVNESGTLLVKAGLGASSSDYTWRVPANSEVDVTNYTGALTGLLDTGKSGVCHVSDF